MKQTKKKTVIKIFMECGSAKLPLLRKGGIKSVDIDSTDNYRHESGMCHTLPFFYTFFFIISPFQVFLLY